MFAGISLVSNRNYIRERVLFVLCVFFFMIIIFFFDSFHTRLAWCYKGALVSHGHIPQVTRVINSVLYMCVDTPTSCKTIDGTKKIIIARVGPADI